MTEKYIADLYHHLRRARIQLDRNKSESLFYAALELRCGVEARIKEYLNAREDIAKKKKKGWKIAEAGKELDKCFIEGLKIVEVAIHSPTTGEELPLFHTPVRPELRLAVAKLGNFLHAQPNSIPNDSSWWADSRGFLEKTFTMAVELAQGTLLAPLLKSPTGKISMHAFWQNENPLSAMFGDASFFTKGSNIKVRVAYHSEMPERATPYLNDWRTAIAT